MAKKIIKKIKLQIQAGKANPAPPIGPALGAAGVNIMAFCKDFNARTQKQEGILPVVITVYQDKTFTFVTLQPPAAELIKKTAGIQAGSKVPHIDKVGKITEAQLEEIVNKKIADMRVSSKESAKKVIAGTARSMGVEIIG